MKPLNQPFEPATNKPTPFHGILDDFTSGIKSTLKTGVNLYASKQSADIAKAQAAQRKAEAYQNIAAIQAQTKALEEQTKQMQLKQQEPLIDKLSRNADKILPILTVAGIAAAALRRKKR